MAITDKMMTDGGADVTPTPVNKAGAITDASSFAGVKPLGGTITDASTFANATRKTAQGYNPLTGEITPNIPTPEQTPTGGGTSGGTGGGSGTGGSGTTGGTGTSSTTTTTTSDKTDAYQRLYNEFAGLGLGSLVTDAKDLLMNATSISAMPDALRNTKAYQTRFSANDARIKAGLAALSPAEYLAKEDAYQNIMRNYGLPASYYTPGLYGKQEGFDKLLANDVSAVELEDRIATAQQRVLNSNPEVLKALRQFYPDLSNADILAYTLDPSNALQNIKRKVTAAEIGGAALAQGLQANGGTAESLAGQGITKEQAQQGYVNVAEMAPRGSQLASIYGESPYGQAQAEAEVFGTAGAADAAKQRKKLKALEEANFGGSSGVGALSRDRANPYGTTQSGYGQY